ncbi:L,D-transpeptidase family protein [Xylanimonas oleitrophica]|uniref:L,D-transpeptidase family protein n=1 Tax=Xylanimonas oleitrophica TaxID=2607479 RepID=UPI0015D0219C|nr:L,D-transpeptidase family protein [Xylanimonas oleitrophica]
MPAVRRALVVGVVLALGACAWPGQQGAGTASPSSSPTSSATASPSASASAEPDEGLAPEPGQEPTPEQDPAGEDAGSQDQGSQDPGSESPAAEDPAADDPAAEGPAGAAGEPGAEAEEDPGPELVQRGDEGPQVEALQQRLQDLGYFLLEVDGRYGWATQQAVWAFQKAAGLTRDGVVGPQTQQALDAGHVPAPRSASGHVLEIDVDRQLVLAVDDGRVVRVINASTGNGERFVAQGREYVARTRPGTFEVYRQVDGMHSSTLELGDMWRPKYFNGAIAVHGSPSVPPYPASHGCVRVSNAAMNWLWDDWGLPQGTTVLVY